MRVASVTMTNFRGIRSATLDCSADVVLIYGRNGAGKTTVFDAIEYAMFQGVARLKELDDDRWDQHLPNVHGDGSFAVRLEFDDDTFITARRSAKGERSGEWPGGSINAFVYDRLMRPGRFARRDIAPVHALMRATHLLLQKDMATLAASGTLDSQKLAALTGSGYLERCREKAANAVKEARKRLRAAELRNAELIDDQRAKEVHAQIWRKLLARRDTALRELASLPLGDFVRGADFANIVADHSIERLTSIVASVQKQYQATERVLASIRTLLSMAPSVVAEDSLMSEASRLSAERESASQLRSDLRGKLAGARKVLQELQSVHDTLAARYLSTGRAHRAATELRDAQSALTRVTNQLLEVEESLSVADAEWQEAAKRFDQARDETTNLRSKVAHAEARITLLRDLQRAEAASAQALAATNAQLAAAEGDVAQGRERLAQAEAVALQLRNVFDQLFAAFNASASDVDKMIAELRALIAADHECPLCGTAFGTAAGLRASIEAQAQRRSMSVSRAQEQIDSARHRRDDAIRREAELRNTLENATARFERLNQQVQSRTLELTRIRAKIGEATAGNPLDSELGTLEDLVSQLKLSLDGSLKASESAQSAVEFARDSLQKHNTRRDELRNASFRSESSVKSLTETLARESREAAVDSTEPALAAALVDLESKLQAAGSAISSARADVLVLERDSQLKVDMLANLERDILANSARLVQVREAKEARHIHLRAIGVPSDATRTELAELEKTQETLRGTLAKILDLSQELVSIVASTLSGDLQEVENALDAAALQTRQAESDLQILNAVAAKAQHWEARLRTRVGAAIQNFVLPRQGEITRIFRSLIPNPFRFNRIDVRQGDDGGLRMGLVFRNFESSHGSPEFFLSAAQMSVLALSIFLALSRSQSWSNLDTIMLDDPVQHLDDLDAVALLDGLRAVSRQPHSKQLIVSTCDRSLYHLMIRKFRLAAANTPQSLIAMTLEDDLQNGIALTYDVGGPASLSAAG